jgi:transcriptional regulator with XRE-family HTH domain
VATKPPTRAALGRSIRQLRLEHELTIEALAGRAHMHPTFLSSIERGQANPSWDKLSALATALDVPISEIAKRAEQH